MGHIGNILRRLLLEQGGYSRIWYGLATAVIIAGGGLIYHQTTTPPGGGPNANIWVNTTAGATPSRCSPACAYNATNAYGSLDAANDVCQNGDTVYVKTASAYAGEVISGSNGRSSACTIAAEPSTADIQFSSDFVFGVNAAVIGGSNGPDWLTIQHVQCGSDNTSFTNAVDVTLWDFSDNITLDDWDCPSFDAEGGSNLTIKNSDFGPCGSNTSPQRTCVSRLAQGFEDTANSNVLIQDTSFHDIWCGTGNAGECAANHTDGIAIFGVTNVTFRRVKFWKNDITNIRVQANSGSGRKNDNLLIENSWFGASCATTTPSNCTGGLNSDAFDIDNGELGLIVRFNSFQQDSRPQCTGGGASDCGSGASNAVFTGNIYSTNASFCGYTKVTMTYNAENHWGGSSDAVCSGTGNTMSASTPPYVTGSGVINFHLNAAYASDSLVTSGCIANDIDLDSRSSTCDAGSDER